jgi:hypothetical protein
VAISLVDIEFSATPAATIAFAAITDADIFVNAIRLPHSMLVFLLII